MTKIFDVSTLAVADEADLELVGPDGKPLLGEDGKPCSITMYGPASDQFAEMQAVQQERLYAEMAKGDERKPLTAAESRKLTASDLRIVTKSFNNFAYGNPGDYAEPGDMHEAAYADRKIGWLPRQANVFFGKWGNFPAALARK